jgi:hypothetical protein
MKNKKIRNAYLKVKNNYNIGNLSYDMSADIEGVTRVERLVILDQKDGKEWEILVHDGKFFIEPYEKDEKRDFRIKKVVGSK